MTDFLSPGARFFRGKAFTNVLERCRIEPHQYWVLVDLFETLSKRQEMVRMGSHDQSMRSVMSIWFFLSGIISLVMVFSDASPGFYLLAFVGLTVFQLGLLLISEVAESLVNPVEGLILAHQPVNGATWLGARLTHLVRIVVYTVVGVNGVPALVGVFLPHKDRFLSLAYFPIHFLTALGVGLIVALLCCSLFGWLIRFVPVQRLKAAATVVQVIPMSLPLAFNFLDDFREEFVSRAASFAVPAEWQAGADAVPGGWPALLGAVTLTVAIVAALSGLRALSRDHLIRVSDQMYSGGEVRRREWGRWAPGPWVSRLAGGQASRAGFVYLSYMMVRDWQFRRNMAQNIPPVIIGLIAMLVGGREVSPFSPGLAYTHALPHLIGITALYSCLFLGYGNDYKGIWLFLIVPDASFRPFVRGVYTGLWLMLIAAPIVFWLIVLIWSWGARDAVLLIAYSTVVAFLYLGVGLRLIDGLPFGKQTPSTRKVITFGMTLVHLAVMGIAIGIQYLLFRWDVTVIALLLVAGLGAYLLNREGLTRFESRLRAELKPRASGSIFR